VAENPLETISDKYRQALCRIVTPEERDAILAKYEIAKITDYRLKGIHCQACYGYLKRYKIKYDQLQLDLFNPELSYSDLAYTYKIKRDRLFIHFEEHIGLCFPRYLNQTLMPPTKGTWYRSKLPWKNSARQMGWVLKQLEVLKELSFDSASDKRKIDLKTLEFCSKCIIRIRDTILLAQKIEIIKKRVVLDLPLQIPALDRHHNRNLPKVVDVEDMLGEELIAKLHRAEERRANAEKEKAIHGDDDREGDKSNIRPYFGPGTYATGDPGSHGGEDGES
jgi:hypothetical protein